MGELSSVRDFDSDMLVNSGIPDEIRPFMG